ncbi:MAG: hypothetical protein ACOYBR_09625 [Fluviibacter sp.]
MRLTRVAPATPAPDPELPSLDHDAVVRYFTAHKDTVHMLSRLPSTAGNRTVFLSLKRWINTNAKARPRVVVPVMRAWIEAFSRAKQRRLPVPTDPLPVRALFRELAAMPVSMPPHVQFIGQAVLIRALNGAWHVMDYQMLTHYGRIESDGCFHTDNPRPESIAHQFALLELRQALKRWDEMSALRAFPGVVAVVHDEIITVSDALPAGRDDDDTPASPFRGPPASLAPQWAQQDVTPTGRLREARAAMDARTRATALEWAQQDVTPTGRQGDDTPAHPINPDAWVWVALDAETPPETKAQRNTGATRWRKKD